MKTSIVVAGSSNTDMVIKTDHLPLPGETVLGGIFFMNAGGKGANQAVAAARLGGQVTFVCKTGNDIFGQQALELFQQEGIKTGYVFTDNENASGVALITVDNKGENCIAVASGANATLNIADVQQAEEEIKNAAVVLAQLEIPLQTVIHVAGIAAKNDIPFILNPAPACSLPDELYQGISIITPNETEAEMLTGIQIKDDQSAIKAGRKLIEKGVKTAVITLGAKGAMIVTNNNSLLVNAPIVNAVDTTAAGDVFNGALCVALAENKPLEEAVVFACKAASVSVTRLGAQASAPYLEELDEDSSMIN
jgi:ribokinase